MTEFYHDLSDAEVEKLISKKMEIYAGELYYFARTDTEWSKDSYEFRYYMKYHNLDGDKYSMYQYMGICEGTTMYRFFNIISNE